MKFFQNSLIRKRVLLALIVVTPTGFLFKFYSGPAKWWFNDYGAGLLYEIFWCLVVFFFLPGKRSAITIPLWVFGITCMLEILQLFNPWILAQVRSNFLGRALIGTTFSWWDFPHYAMGCAIGCFILWRVLCYRQDRSS